MPKQIIKWQRPITEDQNSGGYRIASAFIFVSLKAQCNYFILSLVVKLNLENRKYFLSMLTGLFLLILFEGCKINEAATHAWPAITREGNPWTRWWWEGNALTKEGITAEMEAYKKAGLGGLEITPIYGFVGYEDKFINFLSPEWMELLLHTLREGERLDMGIDMATGTG
jgi:hypothetical protein